MRIDAEGLDETMTAPNPPRDPMDDFEISAPAWRVRRLRAHLAAIVASGQVAREAGEPRDVPDELAHRAEAVCWLRGWDGASAPGDRAAKPPTAKQIAKLARWQVGAGRLRPAQGLERRNILEAVAEEMLSAKPWAFGAIAAAHRETVRRCRAAGLPAPKASRYRQWLKLSGRRAEPDAALACRSGRAPLCSRKGGPAAR